MTTSATLRPGPLAIPPGEAVGGVVLHIYDVVGVLLSTSHLKPGDDIEAAAARAQARALGLDVTSAGNSSSVMTPVSTPRRRPVSWRSRCTTCDDELVGETAARRHNETTGHSRYETITDLIETQKTARRES